MKTLVQSETTTGSLLDRLSNRSPNQIAEATVSRGDLQATNARESILRNLQWLLNTTHLASSVDLSRWSQVQRSVINFGIPELSGRYLSSVNVHQLERLLADAIIRFEPRLAKHTVEVQAVVDGEVMGQRSLTLIISAECIAPLASEPVRLAVQVDIESGRMVKVSE